MRVPKGSFARGYGEPYTPALHVLRGLSEWGKGQLRLRWSIEQEKWCVETRSHRPLHTSEISTEAHWKTLSDGRTVERDTWVRQRDGFILAGYWDAQPQLSDWCIHNLRKYDMKRLGGPEAIHQMLMDQEENKQAALERRHSQERFDMGVDFWESEIWRQGERVSVPRNASGLED